MSKPRYNLIKNLPWHWKQEPGHEDQPYVEWWLEQVAVYIMAGILVRSHARGDQQTANRVTAIIRAGADAEEMGQR